MVEKTAAPRANQMVDSKDLHMVVNLVANWDA